MRRDSGWLFPLWRNESERTAFWKGWSFAMLCATLVVVLNGCTSWWSAGAGAAGAPCVSDRDSLRTRDSAGVCTSTPRVK